MIAIIANINININESACNFQKSYKFLIELESLSTFKIFPKPFAQS